jgi:hypothetical protein
MFDDDYTTPEGYWLPRRLLLPDARSFADVLEYIGEWSHDWPRHPETNATLAPVAPRIIRNGPTRGHYYASGTMAPRKGNEIGPYCTVDTRQIGAEGPRGLAVRATDAVLAAVAPRIVTPDDSLSFQVIVHGRRDDGREPRALVVLEHGYIIGDHWLAYVDPATIPEPAQVAA